MATLDSPQPIYERILVIQRQFRIALSNHQSLVKKLKECPTDIETKNRLDAMYGFLTSLGRSQAELLSQCRCEMEVNSAQLKTLLMWHEKQDKIPIYWKVMGEENDKKIASWRPRRDQFKAKLHQHSVLRSSSAPDKFKSPLSSKMGISAAEKILLENSEIKIIFKNRNGPDSESTSLLRTSRKMQSVLKVKNEKREEPADGGGTTNNGRVTEDMSTQDESSKRSSSDGLSDDTECAEIIPIPPPPQPSKIKRTKKYKPNILIPNIKTNLRLRTRSASFYKREGKNDCDIIKEKCSRDSLVSPSKNELPASPSLLSLENGNNWANLNDVGQDRFLRYFGLINREQCAAIKKKKCERKRRSVAGQSSYYNDYLQPVMPKRTYGPRKGALSAGNTHLNSSSNTSENGSNNANSQVVVVESTLDLDDDEDKSNTTGHVCPVCHMNGNLERCHSCSEVYHVKCTSGGKCPGCHAQAHNIRNIVGANSASSASSMELIKRYLAPPGPTNTTEGIKSEEKQEAGVVENGIGIKKS